MKRHLSPRKLPFARAPTAAAVATAAACGPPPAPPGDGPTGSTGQEIAGGQLESGYQAVGYIARRPKNGGDWKVWCTGTLLRRDAVLSAAPCFDGRKDHVYKFDLGGANFNEGVAAKSLHVHPDYGQGGGHDIAVMMLARQVGQSVTFPKIRNVEPHFGSNHVGVGYGLHEDGAPGPRKSAKMKPTRRHGTFRFWVTGVSGRACDGDSGGPLLSPDGKALYGVVNGGAGCEIGGEDVYADAFAERGFVYDAMAKRSHMVFEDPSEPHWLPPEDGTTPAITSLAPAHGALFYTSVVPSRATASDDVEVAAMVATVNGAVVGASDGPALAVDWDPAGSNLLDWVPVSVTAYDPSGNATAATHYVYVVGTDVTKPVVSFAPPAPALGQNLYAFTATATDDRGVAAMRLYRDGVLVAEQPGSVLDVTVDTSAWSEGHHSLHVNAVDVSGHVGSSGNRFFLVDRHAPLVDALGDGTAVQNLALLRCSTSDASTKDVAFTVDGAVVATDLVYSGKNTPVNRTGTSPARTVIVPYSGD